MFMSTAIRAFTKKPPNIPLLIPVVFLEMLNYCPEIDIDKNMGELTEYSRQIGGRATLSCLEGYELATPGVNSTTCTAMDAEAGLWSPEPPSCIGEKS